MSKQRAEYSRPLSYPQRQLLKSIRDSKLVMGLDKNNNTTLSWAVRRKLIEWKMGEPPHWAITAAGEEALRTGRSPPPEKPK